jgi:hypothetical protein
MWARAGVVDGGGPRGQLEQLKLGLARLVSPLY